MFVSVKANGVKRKQTENSLENAVKDNTVVEILESKDDKNVKEKTKN